MNDYPKAFQDWWDNHMSHLSIELMPHVFEGWKEGIYAVLCIVVEDVIKR